jgi:putative nucleotidyltransferase with HDIG domain
MFDVEALIRWAGQLAPLPPTAAKIAALDAAHAPERPYVEAVMLDPVLTARVLRVANSTMASTGAQFDSLNQVISSAGYGGVVGLAFGDRRPGWALPSPARPAAGLAQWRHAITAAVAARELARAAGLATLADKAFAAGLLHDLGRIVLDGFLSTAQQRAIDRAELYGGLSRYRAEEKLYGLDHAALGAQIAASWQLPGSLVSAVRHHHRAAPTADPVADVVCLANAIAHWVEAGPTLGLYDEESAAMQRLGLEMPLFESCSFRTGRLTVEVLLSYGIDPRQEARSARSKPAAPALA